MKHRGLIFAWLFFGTIFNFSFPFASWAATEYGKGVIYYTENYERNFNGTNSKYNWPIPDPVPVPPISAIHAAYFDSTGEGYSVVKGDRYWYRKQSNALWQSATLQSAYYTSANAIQVGVPTQDIDTAYFDVQGAYTLIKGDRYWYRASSTSNWFTSTLQSAYFTSPNAQSVGVPVANIDAAYYDPSGGYTVIEGDRYWYRTSNTANWSTNTLQSAYSSSSNWQTSGVPIVNVDAAYFKSNGLYTVVQGQYYWYRTSNSGDWHGPDTLTNAYRTQVPGLIQGVECSRYIDLTQREISYFKDLGLDFVILGFGPASWYNVAPTRPANPTLWNDPLYRFSKLDEWIGRLQVNNITPVLQLWGTPTWSSGASKPDVNGCANNPYIDFDPYASSPQILSDYADFVSAVASRYDGTKVTNPFNSSQKLTVTIFSLWNEPNWRDFWKGTAPQYLYMVNPAYDQIKSIRPDAAVWGGNVLGNSADPEGFLSQVNGQLKFDVFALHPYPRNFNAAPDDIVNKSLFAIGNLEYFFQVYDSYPAYRNKPVVLTEIGTRSNWETQFGINEVTISEPLKATYLSQSLAEINRVNTNSLYANRITGVTNNVLYNPWRWWSTGLINYFNPVTGLVDFSDIIPAYQVFKQWNLQYGIVPTSSPIVAPRPTPTPSPSYTITELKTLIQNYLSTSDGLYIPVEGKVNMLDAGYVIRWLAP